MFIAILTAYTHSVCVGGGGGVSGVVLSGDSPDCKILAVSRMAAETMAKCL